MRRIESAVTLVLSCITNEHVIQVSDRRLTNSLTKEVFDDHTNKMIFLDHGVLLGFTGLATIGDVKADIWLAERLVERADQSFDDRWRGVRDDLTNALARLPIAYRRFPHAYVGVGWGRSGADSGLCPFILFVSNFLDHDGIYLKYRDGRFRAAVVPLVPSRDFLLFAVGSPDWTAVDRLKGWLRRRVPEGIGPDDIARLMMRTLWETAESNFSVGTNLMICSLPRASMESDGLGRAVISKRPDRTTACFLSVEPNRVDGRAFGPLFVIGRSIIAGFEAGPLTTLPPHIYAEVMKDEPEI